MGFTPFYFQLFSIFFLYPIYVCVYFICVVNVQFYNTCGVYILSLFSYVYGMFAPPTLLLRFVCDYGIS